MMSEMNEMSEATTRRREEAVDRVLELLIGELEIEPFSLESGDSLTAVDVLLDAMCVAIAAMFIKANLPPPTPTEIYKMCAQAFRDRLAH